MRSSAVIALALCLAAPGARAQSDTRSGSYGNSSANSRNSAGARVGGQPSNVPEKGPSAEGRPRAGYDVGVASATAGGRTDTGPAVGTGTRRRAGEGDQANAEWRVPSLAQPNRGEIREQQQRGRIRDRDVPDRIRGRNLHELWGSG